MATDAELLHAYAAEKSEAAFGELVQRHVNLVYAIALRQCGGDAHLAEDVTQRVFTALARKTRSLSGHAVLGGWLYRSTQFAASDVVRAERRRRAREQEAHAMHEDSAPAARDADWQKLAPVIDQAIGELPDRDRDAVVLRFVENRPFAEIGAILRLTDDAARMRVERALEKLRGALQRRGITSTLGALSVALGNQAGMAAPAELAASVTGAALAAGGAGGVATTLTLMSTTKFITVAAVIAAAAIGLWWQHQANEALRAEVAELRAKTAAANPPPASPALRVRPAERPSAVPATSAAAAPTAVAAPAAGPATGAGLIPIERFVNAGRTTPRAALETTYWARKHIELATLAQSIAFDAEGKAKAEGLFGLLTDELRAQYGTPENFAAGMLADLPSPLGIEVLEQIERGPDDVELKVNVQNADGRTSVRTLPYHRYADGWKTVLPAALVDAAAKAITRNPDQVLRPKATAPAK